MPAYSGKFQYTGSAGETIAQGPCQLTFDKEKCMVTPAGVAPIAFDLGDVDSLVPADWDLQLKLYTGKTIALRQFGPAFSRMTEELTAAWRNRTVECLLLEDLEEAGRFNGGVTLPGSSAPTPAEIRIFKSNIAVLPVSGAATQWRLADFDSLSFDASTYSINAVCDGRSIVFSKLAKKTDEFTSVLEGAFAAIREKTAEALHNAFPFLDPDRLQQLLTVMPEGRSASVAEFGRIHPKLQEALIARAVSPGLKPYFEALRSRASGGSMMTGFKFIRADEESEPDAEADAEEAASEDTASSGQQTASTDETPLFFWFFFPLGKIVAWEAATGSGRATYFFRLPPDVSRSGGLESHVAALTRGLALVNFRREPVYLPDDSLEMQPRFHRYAIAARKLPELRTLRSAFAGRAIHSSLEKWSAQVDAAVR